MNKTAKQIVEQLQKHVTTQGNTIRNIKNMFKSLNYVEIQSLLKGKTMLESEKLEKGTVYVNSLVVEGNFTFSILELLPSSKIKEHAHPFDSEYYMVWRGKDPDPCLIGGTHELSNDKKGSMIVLSIKIKE